jgi:hypothetical protein
VRTGELEGVTVQVRHALTATGAAVADTLASAAGSPWIVAGEGYVLVGSPLDPAATNLPVAAPFLPWVESVIARYLLSDGGRVIWSAPLASVAMPLGVDELVLDGESPIPVQARAVPAPGRAGVYWMRRAGAVVGALVVNAEAAESNLTSLDAAALADRIAGARAQVIAPGDGVARAAFSTAARRPLAGLLLIALAVLLLIETLLARESRAQHGIA